MSTIAVAPLVASSGVVDAIDTTPAGERQEDHNAWRQHQLHQAHLHQRGVFLPDKEAFAFCAMTQLNIFIVCPALIIDGDPGGEVAGRSGPSPEIRTQLFWGVRGPGVHPGGVRRSPL